MNKKRYTQYTGGYGALAALLAYALVQAGAVPPSDVPFLLEAGSVVIGGLGGFLHAWITDTDGTEQRED